MEELDLLCMVALLSDDTERGLVRGQVGTIVERLAPGVYEVEFADGHGRTYALAGLSADRLMRLRYEPAHAA